MQRQFCQGPCPPESIYPALKCNHSSNKCLLSNCSVPSSLIGTRHVAMQVMLLPCCGMTNNKQTRKMVGSNNECYDKNVPRYW